MDHEYIKIPGFPRYKINRAGDIIDTHTNQTPKIYTTKRGIRLVRLTGYNKFSYQFNVNSLLRKTFKTIQEEDLDSVIEFADRLAKHLAQQAQQAPQ